MPMLNHWSLTLAAAAAAAAAAGASSASSASSAVHVNLPTCHVTV